MLKQGDKVEDFTAPVATADGKQEFQLKVALDKGPVLLAFFPAAFTGVCTKELCEVRDNVDFWNHVNAQVFGVSTDPFPSNVAFAKAQNLNFPIVSDSNLEVVPKIWDTQEVGGMKDRAKRGVMVIDTDATVKYVWQTDNPGEWPGLDEVKKVLHAGHEH